MIKWDWGRGSNEMLGVHIIKLIGKKFFLLHIDIVHLSVLGLDLVSFGL